MPKEGQKKMNENRTGLSDEVIIEIVHGIKDVLVELINCAFPREGRNSDQ